MSANKFISEVFQCLSKSDAVGLSRLLNLKNAQYKNLYFNENDKSYLVERFRTSTNEVNNWSDVINYYALFRNSLSNEDYMTAFDLFSKTFKSLNDLIKDAKDENWQLPVLFRLSVDLRLFAYKCDIKKQKNQLFDKSGNNSVVSNRIDDGEGGSDYSPNEYAEKTAESLMASFRILSGDARSESQVK
jgi:hypothetical protein